MLSWDYFNLQPTPTQGGKKGRKATAAAGHLRLRPVPQTFANAEEYTAIFAPLLIEEAKAHVLRGEVRRPCATPVGGQVRC